jgi:hypothetical protein
MMSVRGLRNRLPVNFVLVFRRCFFLVRMLRVILLDFAGGPVKSQFSHLRFIFRNVKYEDSMKQFGRR